MRPARELPTDFFSLFFGECQAPALGKAKRPAMGATAASANELTLGDATSPGTAASEGNRRPDQPAACTLFAQAAAVRMNFPQALPANRAARSIDGPCERVAHSRKDHFC